MKGSGIVSSFCSIIGTLFPIILIIILGVSWVKLGHASAIEFKSVDIIPKMHNINQLAILTGMLFGMVGMEMSAIHAQDVKNPQTKISFIWNF